MSVTKIKTESREQWLEARRRYVTATEVAQLVRRGQDYWDELREIKAGERAASDISNLPAVRHGREREALIAPYVQGLEEGMVPNGDLYVRNGRYAATPDLVGDGIVGEIKTIKDTRLAKLQSARGWPTGQYYDQVQWQLFVTGAIACIFAWEPYEDWDGELVPREDMREHTTIHRDDLRINQLREVADAFLDGRGVDIPTEVQVLLSQLRDVRKEKEHIAQPILDREKQILDEIKQLAGGKAASWDSGDIRVSVSAPGESRRFDKKKLFADNPQLAESDYVTVSRTAPRVRVTERE
ncbi:YqaJ viral recombinase family protein [Corynebacterium urealyticum]|uniref:YqaJ viral recombinase family protein n=1 Tax=Corynebacterium urealyticum TaxID=43771 RepID=UPI00293E3381|nr:YqaJ viral recombinase family protein [Corynebacterium urealyticum]WOH94944.1 YqaJ viral recombinase family protein [Corynebacterium urealyticum]